MDSCLIGEVDCRFGRGTKIRRRFCPPHGKHKGESDQGLRVGRSGKDDAKFRDVISVHPNPIKPVGDVDFDEVDRAEPGIGVQDGFQDALEGPAKLHGISGGQVDGAYPH
jgi:hypothetical protein